MQRPAPPPETVPLLRRVWDAHRTEDWLLNLYVALGDDEKPIGRPELRTFDPDADTEMPTEAAVVIETNPAAADLLEWIAWLLFDGRRSAPR